MRILFLLVCVFIFMPLYSQAQTAPSLMPLPQHMEIKDGSLLIDTAFSVSVTGRSDALIRQAVGRFLDRLREHTGMPPLDMRMAKVPPATLEIHITGKTAVEVTNVPKIEDESYTLEISSTKATLEAPTALGAMHGLQTFLQLVENTPAGFAVPTVSIQDAPRFAWRGLMIDSGRHFIPLDVIKRNLDAMEAVKLNIFHWHLSDDQGFRAESKRFPKLTGMGSDGLFYTQQEMREIVRYARDRGIRVVPEFDMPGHATSWFAGYPYLASAPGPYRVERDWGVFNPAMDPTKASTYKFLDSFIGEMARIFPDRYFHIGGDEVNGKQWSGSPHIRAFMRTHHLETNDELQAYFNRRLQKIVQRHGKIMMGWDEILQPDLPKSIVIQSWRGQKSLAQAAQQGYRGILSSGYYLDLIWPASRHYAVDPISDATANLTPEQQKLILGGEACMWSEYASPENIDSRIWPRMAAIAERLWSPQSVQDVNSMYARMAVLSKELDELGLTQESSYPGMLRRIAGTDDISALRMLADVVEPTRDYTRYRSSPVKPTSLVPLNRLIDAARPESITARHFSQLVDAFLAPQNSGTSSAQAAPGISAGAATAPGTAVESEAAATPPTAAGLAAAPDHLTGTSLAAVTPVTTATDRVAATENPAQAEAKIRAMLTRWQNAQTQLQPLEATSFLMKEVTPQAQNLSSVAAVGLQALDYLDQHKQPPAEWTTQQLALLQSAKTRQAQVFLMIVDPVQKLVQASAANPAVASK